MRLPITSKISALPGVGGKRRELLEGAGIFTIADLLWALPYRYIDRGSIAPIGDLHSRPEVFQAEGATVSLLGTILDIRQSVSRYKRMPITEALLGDETGSIRLIWFNQPHLPKMMGSGDTIFVWGQVQQDRRGFVMQAPAWEMISGHDPDAAGQDRAAANNNTAVSFTSRYYPLYRRISTMQGRARKKLVSDALAIVEAEDNFLPLELAKGLPGLMDALRLLHAPPDHCDPAELQSHGTPAHQRLILEELFAFALGAELRRSTRLERHGEKVPKSPELSAKLKSFLPFHLTPAQRLAFREIVEDITSGRVMNRLLQGDVGSGKTLVAFLTMAMVAETGGQAVLLVPTEVLARQHRESIGKLLGESAGQMQLLTGQMKAAEKRTAAERIANGNASYVVGTHSLFQEAITFSKLQLVVVDEQHRFGVRQREAIKAKGADPHWLLMSATPIPRSLALALFGDMDQSVLDMLPPGRQPVQTHLFEPHDAEKAWGAVESEIAKGHQAFVVSPAIDASSDEGQQKISLRDITQMEALLRARFPSAGISVVHGRLKSDEMAARMSNFIKGASQILLATTVIEVGVDIPNATIMVVDHAERFGLSQLHQLRGRVGRGQAGGIFMMISKGETERLNALVQSSDGFRIAQKDLELRGPGDFFGTRQSGLPQFQVADLVRDRQLLFKCKDAAAAAVKRGLSPGQEDWLKFEQARLKLAEL
ncbi:MAG: ATP-dependent DNA helicase RecG [Holophagales bacterium]|jgi:ATP-dependent DNA helicase RecG|nr:ATP-dependent DNA helicase RecG [Holophagales bacterium]